MQMFKAEDGLEYPVSDTKPLYVKGHIDLEEMAALGNCRAGKVLTDREREYIDAWDWRNCMAMVVKELDGAAITDIPGAAMLDDLHGQHWRRPCGCRGAAFVHHWKAHGAKDGDVVEIHPHRVHNACKRHKLHEKDPKAHFEKALEHSLVIGG